MAKKTDETKLPKGVHTVEERIEELHKMRDAAMHAASEEAIKRQHERGKLTARERIDLLLDPGSFHETDWLVRHRTHGFGIEKQRPYGDAVVTGWGTVDGRKVFVFSQDFAVIGGSLGEVMSEKICKIMDLAMEVGAPVIGLNDSGGARIQEGVVSLASYGYIFDRNVRSSGVIPQISVIMGPCAGGAVYSPAMTDFIFMVKGTSHMAITGPEVIRAVTGEEVTLEDLGGAMTHASKSGIAHFVAEDEKHCIQMVRYLLSFLPANNMEDPPYFPSSDPPDRRNDELVDLMPDEPNRAYDMVDVIKNVVDDGDFMEVFPHYARNIVTGFGRLNGHTVGIVANQPMVLAGVLDVDSSEKGARFVRFCDAFNIPLIVFVDVPGFLPGTNQEWNGIIRRGAKLLFAFSEATVPRIQMVTRKAYGGAYVVMNSKSIRADIAFAWPTAEFAVMGAEGAVNIIHRKDIEKADDKAAKRAELVADYAEKFVNPWVAAERGYIDDVIDPRETRARLIDALELLLTKRETLPPSKHGNIPL
ncbi:MAG TPA: acyl-CoA carboxylase subunit beta [Actinomycetota bacterium]|nr:acyl-CoA carboxylase subunit beta [Actinomycetota bacterium]